MKTILLFLLATIQVMAVQKSSPYKISYELGTFEFWAPLDAKAQQEAKRELIELEKLAGELTLIDTSLETCEYRGNMGKAILLHSKKQLELEHGDFRSWLQLNSYSKNKISLNIDREPVVYLEYDDCFFIFCSNKTSGIANALISELD